jgi:tetratricopeptide (TPR) repeat protein
VRLTVLTTAAALLVAALVAAADRETIAQRKETARLAADRGALGEAVHFYEDLVRTTPRDIDARLRLAELYARAHDLDRSISAYRDLLALDPANLRGTMGLARVLRWSHRYADAEQLYKEVLAAAPDDGDAIEGLAQTYALAGTTLGPWPPRPGGSRSRQNGPARPQGHGARWQGRLDDRRAWTERAIALNPRSAGIERGLGDILMWKRDYDEAAQAYHRALELDATSIPTALDLATAYQAAGKTDVAEDVVKDALRRAPDDRKALERLQELRRGRRWDASRLWRVGLEGATHAGLPLGSLRLLWRRRLVRQRPPLSTTYEAVSQPRPRLDVAFVTGSRPAASCRWSSSRSSSCRWRSPCPPATGRPALPWTSTRARCSRWAPTPTTSSSAPAGCCCA